MKRHSRGRMLTDVEAEKYAKIREKFEAEKPEIDKLAAVRARRRDRIAAIVARIRQLRAEQGLTLAEISERTGIDGPALSRLENGKPANPSIETLMRYAEAVGAEISITTPRAGQADGRD